MGAYKPDFITVVTDSFDNKPDQHGYRVWSSQPVSKSTKQVWGMVRADRYDFYKNIDLHFDCKSLEDAKGYLNKIDDAIKSLENDKVLLRQLLASIGEL